MSIVARLEDIKVTIILSDGGQTFAKGIKARFYIAGTGSYENHLKEKVKV